LLSKAILQLRPPKNNFIFPKFISSDSFSLLPLHNQTKNEIINNEKSLLNDVHDNYNVNNDKNNDNNL
jgi:hypothetical protein